MNGYQLNNRLNQEIDIDQLDKLAKTNPMAKERQLSEMKNLLQNAAHLIGGYQSSKVDVICSQLQIDGFNLNQCKKAFDLLIDRFDKFPSYREIKQLIRQISEPRQASEYRDLQSVKDENKYNCLKKLFLEKADQSKLDSFVLWWLKETYNLKKDEILKMGFNTSMFEMPALFDWHDAYYQWDLEKIKFASHKKLTYIIEQNNNNRLKEPMEFNRSTEYLKYSEV